LKMFQIEHRFVLPKILASLINRTDNHQIPTRNSFRSGFSYPISMKRSELTNKQKLLVPCPICGAAIGVHCQMYSGFGRRNEAHPERKYYAVQAIEQGYGRYDLLRTFIRVESAHVWQASDSAINS
jgi:hypothetical protein